MQRRNFVKTVGGIVGTSAVGGATLLAASGGASASAGGSIEDPDTATSDDGRIKWVAVQTTGRLTWDGFDEPAKYGQIVVDVELWQDGESIWAGEIHDTGTFSLDGDWGGEGEETSLGGDNEAGQEGYIASDADWGIVQRDQKNLYNDGYGLPETPAPASYLTAHEDGSKRATRVVLKSEYRLFDADENELTGSSGYPDRPQTESDFVVTIENEAATTGFGDEDGDGDTGDNATVGV